MNRFEEPDTSEIAMNDKIERLERRLGRTQRRLAWMWAMVALLGVHAAWPAPGSLVTIERRQLVVRDDEGHVRVTLGTERPGTGKLDLYDARGHALASLTADDLAGRLQLGNANDRPGTAPRVTLSAGLATELALRGATAEVLRFEAGPSSRLTLRYPNGEPAFTAVATSPGDLFTLPRTSLSAP